MTIPDTIALSAALGTWIAIYIQWRSVRASERDVQTRIDTLQDVLRQIQKERTTRSQQIEERKTADLELDRQDALRQIHAANIENELLMLEQLFMYQQFGLAYLARAEQFDTIDPDLGNVVWQFKGAVAVWISQQNLLRKHLNQLKIQGSGDEELKRQLEAASGAWLAANQLGIDLVVRFEKVVRSEPRISTCLESATALFQIPKAAVDKYYDTSRRMVKSSA